MKKIILNTLLIISSLLLLGACVNEPEVDPREEETRLEFLALTEPGVSIDGKLVDQILQEDQVSYTEDRTEYCVSNLSFTKYYHVSLDHEPILGEKIKAKCASFGVEGLDLEETTFEVLNVSGDMVWIWHAKSYTGILMKFE